MPHLEVQVYHDARMAEVVSAEHTRRLRSIYPYPNEAMHQPDEKAQLNLFLGEWLSHCGLWPRAGKRSLNCDVVWVRVFARNRCTAIIRAESVRGDGRCRSQTKRAPCMWCN